MKWSQHDAAGRHVSGPVVPAVLCILLMTLVLAPAGASAHCDGLDGPVVTAARRALSAGDVKPALIWVKKEDEPEITRAFSRAMAVRRLGPKAKELADLYFFETLVRVHRAGEGAPYTGIRPAGRDLGPAIPAADRSLDTGDQRVVSALLGDAMSGCQPCAGPLRGFGRLEPLRAPEGAGVTSRRSIHPTGSRGRNVHRPACRDDPLRL